MNQMSQSNLIEKHILSVLHCRCLLVLNYISYHTCTFVILTLYLHYVQSNIAVLGVNEIDNSMRLVGFLGVIDLWPYHIHY